jgi:glycerate kinase
MISRDVEDPLGRPISATYWLSGDGTTAFIEVASASGLVHLSPHERNPLHTSTWGTGQLILDAKKRNVRSIVIGIGGTATNDGGIGIAAALGAKFLDPAGGLLKPIGENLKLIDRIDVDNLETDFPTFTVLCDVKNPLYGPDGAAFVYASQKGAAPHEVQLLDDGLRNLERVFLSQFGQASDFPGAGAGGGVGVIFKNFFNATFMPGIDFFNDAVELEKNIFAAELVFTGEGRLDHQTFAGKVVSGVATLCRKHNKPLIVVTGQNELSSAAWKSLGISSVVVLTDEAPLHDCMTDTARVISERIKGLKCV